MPFGTQSYSEFGNELNLESINNLRLLTSYHPNPSDANVSYSSNQASKTYSVDLSTFFDPDFTFDSNLWEFLVIVEPESGYTSYVEGIYNSTSYIFTSNTSIKHATYSFSGTTLTIVKSTEDYVALSGVRNSLNNFCSNVGCSGATSSSYKVYRYSGGIFNVFLKEK
jgi:hypothetical protein